MRKFQQFSNIILISIILLISINFLLGWIWELRTKIKFKNFEPYDETVREALNLNKADSLILYLETHIGRNYEYAPFLGHAENQGYDNKFVNVNPELGRKTISPTECEKNIFLYGGSTTFGAGVTDNQTIPSYLGEMLIDDEKKICVKNYGRRSYFAFQETILLQKHILKQKIKSNDIIIFLDGINENGYNDPRNTALLNQLFKISNKKYWDMEDAAFILFLDSLTINQFFKRVMKKLGIDKKKETRKINSGENLENIRINLEKNIVLRNSICNSYELYCFNFLQPFATIHGKYFDKPSLGVNPNFVNEKEQIEYLKKRWYILNKTKGVLNIADALKNSKKLGYIDRVHYSPYGNKRIAEKIYNIISKDF